MILPGFQNQDAEKLYEEALNHLRKGALDQGIACLQSAIKLVPFEAKYYNNMGQALILKGEREQAFQVFKKAFDLDPNHTNTLNNLGILSLERGELPQAQTYLERSLSIKPENNFDALAALGNFYGQQKNYSTAENLLNKALALQPNSYAVKRNLAIVSLPLQKFEDTIKYCEAALEKKPDDHAVLLNYASALSKIGRRFESIEIYKRLLESDETDQKAWINLISAYEYVNDIDNARKTVETAKPFCDSLEFEVVKARLAIRDKNSDLAAVAKNLENYLEQIDVLTPQNSATYFELGKIYDRLKEPEKAFMNFKKANDLQAQSSAFSNVDKDLYTQSLDKIIATVNEDWAKNWSDALPYTEKPEMIFLVGFPRSGTTLMDQILHSHPDIEVSEENPAISNLLLTFASKDGESDYPEILPQLDHDHITELRKQYFETIKKSEIQMDRPYLVDKMPLSIAQAGLIYRMFPDAKFIVALRHPCDCVLSCFMQQFYINTAMANFYNIEDAANLYDKVFTIWELYKKHLPLNYHEMKYEDVVGDFRNTVAGVLEFIGVPWDDTVLEYDRTAKERGVINTPSYNQVTQKIYTRAAGRWKRYREQMEPVLDILLPWAAHHDYDVS